MENRKSLDALHDIIAVSKWGKERFEIIENDLKMLDLCLELLGGLRYYDDGKEITFEIDGTDYTYYTQKKDYKEFKEFIKWYEEDGK